MTNTDWFSQLELRRTQAIAVLLVIVFATLAVSSLRDPIDYDSFWHLKMGQDWIEKGLSPFQDHYSISHYGEEVRNPPYLFEALLYEIVDLLGVGPGFKFYVFAALSLSVIMMMLWLRFIKAPTVLVLLIVSMLVVVLQTRAQARPELLAYPLLIFSLILYERARSAPGPRNFLAIALTMLVFANYHSGVLGYVVFFGLFVDLAVANLAARAPLRTWIRWGSWGTSILAVGFLTHAFRHPVLSSFGFSGEWFDLIREYRSPWEGSTGVIAFFLMIAAVTAIGLLIRQRLFGYAIVCAVFAWQAARLGRLIAPSGVVVLCLLSLALSRLDLGNAFVQASLVRRRAAAVVFSAFLVFALFFSFVYAKSLVRQNLGLLGYFPDRLVEYMNAGGKHGRIFNEFDIGGYLIYNLGTESRVYVDGRTNILYTVEDVRRWQEVAANSQNLASELDRLGIDFVILDNSPYVIRLMRGIESMKLDFTDLRYSLYTRKDANFPISGSLWSKPWCWAQGTGDRLEGERQKALLLLPQYSLLIPLTDLAAGYAGAADKPAFIRSLIDKSPDSWSDPTVRIAAYRALELGMYAETLELFSKLRGPYLRDVLAMGLANLRLGRMDQAWEMARVAIQNSPGRAEPDEYAILYGLVAALQMAGPSNQVLQVTLDKLAERMQALGIEVPAPSESLPSLCSP